jgi:hypothetical protein
MFKHITKFLIAFLLVITASNPSYARKFYVSASGNNSNTFDQAQDPATPWATLGKVASTLGSFSSGDSILFKRGDKFSGSISISGKTNLFFGPYGTGADPLFWGTGATIRGLFICQGGSSGIKFYGLKISDTTISPTDRTILSKIQDAFINEGGANGTVIRKCTVDRCGQGVGTTETTSSITVDSCDFGNLRMIVNNPGGDNDYGATAVVVACSNNTITNNYFHDCWANSFDYQYDGGSVEFFEAGVPVQNNVIAYNTFYDNNGTFEHGSSPDGVPNNLMSNNRIYYNKIINCGSVIYINNRGKFKTKVTNVQLYNNVIVQNVTSRTGGLNLCSMATDTAGVGILVFRNNIFQVSNGAAVMRVDQWNSGQLTHTNNLYKLSNGSVTNLTLDPTEIETTSAVIWTNTTNPNPLNWNYNLTSTSPARGSGVNVGLTRDFAGNTVSGVPDMGILKYIAVVPACTFAYSAWGPCINNSQTRSYTSSPNGCTGVPPADSILRTCVSPCIFTYGSWSVCTNNLQTRNYSSSPIGCAGTPPADSIQRSCTPAPCVSFVYGSWSTCVNGTQTRTYLASPQDCVGNPPSDSLSRSCAVACTSFEYYDWSACINGFQSRDYNGLPIDCVGQPPADSTTRACVAPTCPYVVSTTFVQNASCSNRTDGYATISVSCGEPIYTYRLTNTRTGSVKTIMSTFPTQTFYFLGPGRYKVNVTSSNGRTGFTVFTIIAIRRRNC